MTPMKIVQFSRAPPPLSIYVQNSSIPLTLDVQFQTNPHPSPNDNQSIKRTHNPRIPFFTSFHLAEASPSTFSSLYTLVCAVVLNITKCILFTIIHIFGTHFAINLFYSHNLKT